MRNYVFNAVKTAFEGIMFKSATDEEVISQFHHHLGKLLNEEMSSGNIGSFAISNVNLLNAVPPDGGGPFVRVSVIQEDGTWKHYQFSSKTDTDSEIHSTIKVEEL